MNTDPSNPVLPALFGGTALGILGVVILWIIVFVVSAWLFGLWLRLLVRFHQRFFDREYARMRGDYRPPARPSRGSRGPRDSGGSFFE